MKIKDPKDYKKIADRVWFLRSHTLKHQLQEMQRKDNERIALNRVMLKIIAETGLPSGYCFCTEVLNDVEKIYTTPCCEIVPSGVTTKS